MRIAGWEPSVHIVCFLVRPWVLSVFLGLLSLGGAFGGDVARTYLNHRNPSIELAALVPPESGISESTSSDSPAVPFLNLRDRVLEYSGPEPADRNHEPDPEGFRIGWFAPNSFEDVENAPMWWAAQLAVQQANEQGGVNGRPVRLVSRWTTDVWSGGAALASQLVYEDHVTVLIGSHDGPATHLAEQIVAKARVPLISPVSTDFSVNLAGVAWMFSLAPDDSQIAAFLVAQLVTGTTDGKRHVLLAGTDHDSRLAVKAMRAAMERHGMGLDLMLEFSPGTTELARLISRIPDGWEPRILVFADASDSARVVRTLRDLGKRSEIVGSAKMGTLAFVSQVGAAGEGVRFPLLFTSQDSPAAGDRFDTRFLEQFGREPDYRAAYTYDAVELVIAALRTGAESPGDIRNALRQLSPWTGITGSIQWDGLGQNTGWKPRMGMIHEGRIVPMPETGLTADVHPAVR